MDGATDIAQINTAALPLRDSPFPRARQFRVMLDPDAYAAMWSHAECSLADGEVAREVGGFLIGDLYRDELGPYLKVTNAVRATHTRNEHTELAFTPDTWADVNRIKAAEYPERKIVGWYHTHPDFGVFLSERDCFIHRHSFPQPWAVAWVIDPVQKEEGLFVWQEGEPREASEYWVGQEHRDRARTRQAVIDERTSIPAEPAPGSWSGKLTTTLLGIIAAGALAHFGYQRWVTYSSERLDLERLLESERIELDRALQLAEQLRPSQLERDESAHLFRPPLDANLHYAQDHIAGWATRANAASRDLGFTLDRLRRLNAVVSRALGPEKSLAEQGKVQK